MKEPAGTKFDIDIRKSLYANVELHKDLYAVFNDGTAMLQRIVERMTEELMDTIHDDNSSRRRRGKCSGREKREKGKNTANNRQKKEKEKMREKLEQSEEDGDVRGVWIVANVVELEEEDEGTAAQGADPSTGQMKINAMNHVESVQGEDRRAKFRKIRDDRDDGFVQKSKIERRANVWKRQLGRSNKFDVLNLTEGGLEVEEVNAVDVVQEVVEITVDPGVANSGKKGVTRKKGDKNGAVGGSKRQFDACGRRRETGIRPGRQEVQHEVLGR